MRAVQPILIAAILLTAGEGAFAVVKVSGSNGAWNDVIWSPAGTPGPGDTIVIASQVEGMPAGVFGRLSVSPGGKVSIAPRQTPSVADLYNEGTIAIGGAALRVRGDAFNAGTIHGAGRLELTGSGSAIGGYGEFGNVFVNPPTGNSLHLFNAVTMASLLLGYDCTLLTGMNDLTINGSYASLSDYGADGIVSTGGTVRLNGNVEGSVRGTIRLGSVGSAGPGSIRPPSVHGILGDPSGSVTFAASRRVGFSTLRGDVFTESGTVVTANGIGFSGRNVIQGSLTVGGVLNGAETDHIWEVHGDITNRGWIEFATIRMVGHDLVLDNSDGAWGGSTRLRFFGDTGGSLSINGDTEVSELIVGTMTAGNSNVVVNTAFNALRIRHRYISDRARNCRVVSNATVSVGGTASGIIDGQVLFDGFWHRTISGTFGRVGKEVRISVPRVLDGSVRMIGTVRQNPFGRIRIVDDVLMEGVADLRGEITLEDTAQLTVTGKLAAYRLVRGGGEIVLLGPDDSLNIGANLIDSVGLVIGDGSTTSIRRLTGPALAPRLHVTEGSSLRYNDGDFIHLATGFDYDILHQQGEQRVSPAADPFERRGGEFLGGSPAEVLAYDGVGYVPVDSINAGVGYKVDFPAETVVTHRGDFINLPLTIPVVDGWNQIGAASLPAAVSRVTLSGVTLDSGFQDINGTNATTLQPGSGYLVKVIGTGTITLNAEP